VIRAYASRGEQEEQHDHQASFSRDFGSAAMLPFEHLSCRGPGSYPASEDQTMFRSWTATRSTCSIPDDGPVQGLRQALTDVGLSSFIPRTEAWCWDVGAAFLEEVLEEVDDLCDHLELSGHQRDLLRSLAPPSAHSVANSPTEMPRLARSESLFSHSSCGQMGNWGFVACKSVST